MNTVPSTDYVALAQLLSHIGKKRVILLKNLQCSN